MSSGPIRNRAWSIEGRLFFLFTTGTTVLLIALSLTLYGAIRGYMDQRVAASLADKIEDSRGDLDDPDGIDDLSAKLAAQTAAKPDYWLRVLDANGRQVAESTGMDKRAPLAGFPPPAFSPVHRDVNDSSGDWITLAAQEVTADRKYYLIEVAEDRRADADFLMKVRWMLSALAAGAILFSGILARVVTRRGLRPLKAMELAAERVRVPLHLERLGKNKWPRELAPLAAAFDEMMDRLEESFNRLSQFSADIAHELRTPIANLRGEAEIALNKGRTQEEYRQVIESSLEEYARLTAMTEKLLFLARADAQEAEVKIEELDARAEVDALWEFYEPYAEERGVLFKRDGAGVVRADPVLLRRAVANLIENALKFTPAGNEVAIQVTTGIVKVADTGNGIAPEHMPRLFDRFYQIDPSRSSSGAGLGLALVKSIMKLHGGTVTVTSSLGQGTEATLRFPL